MRIEQDKPIVAYKALLRAEGDTDDGVFYSSQQHTAWNGNELMATCIRSNAKSLLSQAADREAHERLIAEQVDHAPAEDCSCGIYAARTLSAGAQWFNGEPRESSDKGRLTVVQLQLSGKVFKGERGYRAQYARIIAYFWKDQWVDIEW